MATINELRTKFNSLPTAQKKPFITHLRQQVEASQNVEHIKFLNECIQKYNAEAREIKESQQSSTAPGDALNQHIAAALERERTDSDLPLPKPPTTEKPEKPKEQKKSKLPKPPKPPKKQKEPKPPKQPKPPKAPKEPKKRRIWLWVVVGIVAAGVIGQFFLEDEQSGSSVPVSVVATPTASQSDDASIQWARELSAKYVEEMREKGISGQGILYLTAEDVLELLGEPDSIGEDRDGLNGSTIATWEYSDHIMKVDVITWKLGDEPIRSVHSVRIGHGGTTPILGFRPGDDFEEVVSVALSIGFVVNAEETAFYKESGMLGDVAILDSQDFALDVKLEIVGVPFGSSEIASVTISHLHYFNPQYFFDGGETSAERSSSTEPSAEVSNSTDTSVNNASDQKRALSAESLDIMYEKGPDAFDIAYLVIDDVLDYFGEPDSIEDGSSHNDGSYDEWWTYSDLGIDLTIVYPSDENLPVCVGGITILSGSEIPFNGIPIGADWDSVIAFLSSIGYVLNEDESDLTPVYPEVRTAVLKYPGALKVVVNGLSDETGSMVIGMFISWLE